mmetsp:Transcript_1658/g.1644  ORF Transcript_1658/g.1644 Transcript_1658/m.1644 type:complete len:609 (+) Transcript_1658:39-1865(+)
MTSKGPSIAPRLHSLAPSPIAIANTPPSADSPPQFLRTGVPQAKKGSPGDSSGGSGVTQIITSKEWVLPPRPKPGRKPSIDTPASKRKAQNRAAQRAFRERRAGRVQELEEKLLEVEKERDVKEMGLVNTINKLKVENQFLLKSIDQLRNDMNALKSVSSSNSQVGMQQNTIPSQYNTISHFKSNPSPNSRSTGSPSGSSSYSVQQISPAPSADSPPVFTNVSAYNNLSTPASNNNSPDKRVLNNATSSSFDCGVCVKEECLCETVGLKDPEPIKKISLEETIKEFKPMPAVSLGTKKRKLTDPVSREIDFTKKFSTSKPMPDLKKLKKQSNNNAMLAKNKHVSEQASQFDESSPVDNCGFCSDDTPCVCREAAKEAARFNNTLNEAHEESNDAATSLPPIQLNSNNFRKSSLPVMHPGPSVEIRDITNLSPGAVPTVVAPTTRVNSSVFSNETPDREFSPAPEKKAGGCTGNPGTCEQCQMDPMSTLFCTTVANKEKDEEKSRSNSTDPGSKSPSSLKESNTSQISRLSSKTSLPSISVSNSSNSISPERSDIFIPCSDAYRTLSRHKKFNSVDFSTLVGKLTTRGMQVEVQSVANVLRELDRRVYN